jgi:hypothetical protein
MKTLLRSLASACGLLTVGLVVGINVGSARSDHRAVAEPSGQFPTMLAQAAPSQPSTSPDKPAGTVAVDMAVLERVISRAATAAFDKAAAGAVERLQKAMVPAELTSLRQRIGEFDKLRNEIRTAISEARAQVLQYALWGAVAFFGVMVLASIVGGAVVAALFRPRHRA